MSRKTQRATAIAVAATLLTTLAAADWSGANAQDDVRAEQNQLETDAADAALPKFVAEPVVQALPEEVPAIELAETAFVPTDAQSLSDLVGAIPAGRDLSQDLQCLAGAIYFESRGEPLSGQLAVARVIVNRAESSRFPDTYCDVVYQRSQFSFVRGGRMPAINTGSSAWRNAKAIAQIAHEGLWDSPAQGALFFHATHVNPGWRLQRVATVSRHVFYR